MSRTKARLNSRGKCFSLAVALIIAASLGQITAAATTCQPLEWPLVMGQKTVVGTITVWNDATVLHVQYSLLGSFVSRGYKLGNLHLWVGTDLQHLPTTPNKQRIPIPGQFPYKYPASDLTEYQFKIPLSEIPATCGQTIYVVPQAEIIIGTSQNDGWPNLETAWGGDQDGWGPRWWFYGAYRICCEDDEEEQPPMCCETAFAKGTHVFARDPKANPDNLPSLNLTKNQWGWAIRLYPLPSTATSYGPYAMWAAAGLNDISNGFQVGTLSVTVSPDGSTPDNDFNFWVKYQVLEGSTCVFREIHLYIGDTPPTDIAPGKFPIKAENLNEQEWELDQLKITDTNGDGIWIVAHAKVCCACQQ